MTNPKTLFAMITTDKSSNFTELALKSFFVNTNLNDGDIFILIDNDNTWTDIDWPRISLYKNIEPKSFAENINQLIDIADNYDLDLVVMNNDIIFTPNWRNSLERRSDIICLPSCNQTHTYVSEQNSVIFPYSLDIKDFNNNWSLLYKVAQNHTTSNRGYFERLETPFYCFRLPKEVFREVGKFDENFQPAGGEDIDYRIRAEKQGFSTLYTNESYLLHFCGRSTWNGSETAAETQSRNFGYFATFAKKYGDDAANLFCRAGQPIEKTNEVVKKYNLLETDNFESILSKVLNFDFSQKYQIPSDRIAAEGLIPYLQNLGPNIVGCELGVCQAMTLRHFLDNIRGLKKVYAIDAWKPYMDHWGFVTEELVTQWKTTAYMLLTPHQDRVEIIEADSFIAADAIANRELDYIFIDGDHSFSAVARDLRRYWPKVKPGGIFAGHDWQLEPVKTAVEHFRKEYNITTPIQFTKTNVWFWYKEE